MTEDVPAVIEDLALGSFRLVKEKLAFELDFTPETLPVLDHYLIELRDDGTPDEKVASLVGPCVGAYFGEVVRRTLPGLRWHAPPDDYKAWRLEGLDLFVCFNPVGAALEAMFGEAIPDWNAHITLLPEDREPVEESLAATGGVREDDYHRLAVRYEVLDQTMAVLSGRAGIGDERKHFGPDVYALVVDGRSSPVDA